MIGLPRETKEDREGITALARQILAAAPRGSRPRLNVSLSSFIPKPHTPFQWERQEDLVECRRRLHEVKDRLRQKNIQTKWNSAAQTWLEGCFPGATGAWRRYCWRPTAGGAAWTPGANTCGWNPGGRPFMPPASTRTSISRERRLEELLPWDHVDCGVSREIPLGGTGPGRSGAGDPGLPRLGLPGLRRLRPGPHQSQAGGRFALPPAPPPALGPRPAVDPAATG